MQEQHMAYPFETSEGFPIDIEIIDVIEGYVLFRGGLKLEVEVYLSLDDIIDDGEDADQCIVNHPAYGYLNIDIFPEPVTKQ